MQELKSIKASSFKSEGTVEKRNRDSESTISKIKSAVKDKISRQSTKIKLEAIKELTQENQKDFEKKIDEKL